MYTIGELAKMKNMTIKALRFYEKIGLFKPAYIDPNNQYRYYTKEQLPILDIIKSARALDISPKALIPLIRAQSTPLVFSELEKHQLMLQEQISHLDYMINQIEAIKHSYKDSKDSMNERGVYERVIDTRFIVIADAPEPLTIDSLDHCYNTIEKQINENNFVNTYQYGLLLENHKKGVYPDKAFIVVHNPTHQRPIRSIDCITNGRYICTNYTKKTGAKKQKALTKYLEKNNLVPKKLLQVELVSDFFNTTEEVFELQVLVESF